MTFNSESEKQQFVTKVIDRLLYCEGFKDKLQELMEEHPIPETVKLTHNPVDFNQK